MGLVVIALVGLVYYIGQNHFRRATAMKAGRTKTRDEAQPYLQLKVELEAEGTRKKELEANDRGDVLGQGERYEIEGDGGRTEMTEINVESRVLPSLLERHELRGEEHVKELDGHEIENH